MARSQILVAGGGIAGCVAAAGLAAAGRAVCLVTQPRSAPLIEGRSRRAADALAAAGCRGAGAVPAPWVDRVAHWNGGESAANGEYLVDRVALDAALLADARAAGARVRLGRIEALTETPDGWLASGRGEGGGAFSERADFLVEARGRQAPAGRAGRRHGPPATALTRLWRVDPGRRPVSAVSSFADGWAWLAAPGDGHAALQVVVAGEALPGRRDIAAFYDACVAEIPEAGAWLDGAVADGPVTARNANAVLSESPVAPRALRVGDAAVAVDPLSGHGQFVAAGTALNAVAVAATLIDRPADADLARAFFDSRVADTFLRQARVGRDFYRMEQRWADRPYWSARAAWPDSLPAHPPPGSGPARVARLPVIADGYVTARDVVVTADHPRGVWQVDGVALVPLMRFLGRDWRAGTTLAAQAAAHFDLPVKHVETALSWLAGRGLLTGRAAATPSTTI